MSLGSATSRGVLRYCLFGAGVLLLVTGGVLLYVGRSRFEVRAFGLVACVLSAYTIRKSRQLAGGRAVDEQPGISGSSQRPSATMWGIGVGLIALVAVAYALLYQDAVHGYKDIVPVYLFTGAILTAAAFWGYLIARIL